MEVATGALPSLLPKLADLLISEYNLQKGVKGEIMFLKAELEYMKGALEKISETPANQVDNQDKIWARDVRELSYDIEDSIDTFVVRARGGERTGEHGFKKFIDRSLILLTQVNIRRKIATDIREIKIRVEEVSKRRDRYKINNSDATKPTAVDPRLFSQYKKATELVGIDDARDELIGIMMEGNQVSRQQHKIVSIVGPGGLGKTTLANVVYQQLKSQFDCSAFVSVSQVPDMEKLFKDLFYKLAGENNASVSDIMELRELLHNKRYFIILDDLWHISAWNMISSALPDNKCGYKIITTTRIFSVAEQVGRVYKMEPLSLHNSRILLYSRIFGSEDRANFPHEELVEVSDKILRKCAGVPLAIITIASLLASKGTNKMEWYEVYNSIVSGLGNSENVNIMRSILSLSYHNLPSHLRTCLLYLSVFPEDHAIGKDRLIWMWIAEGIIQCENQSKSLFELGESYFNELINRSMIQVYEKYSGMTIYCRLHDMVLDLVRFLSREENFVTISYGDTEHSYLPNMVRRLSLQNGQVDHATWASRSMKQVRSIIVFPSSVNLMPSLGRFKVLRVLDLEDCVLPDNNLMHIGKLFHLRYLGLRGTRIAQLPEEIGTLRFLQTLDVTGTRISNLPPTILQLRQLMCLRMEWCRVPNGIGNITSLEELSFVWITDDSTDILEELGLLTELRVLIIISFTEWTDCLGISLMECLRKLQKIQTLRIKGVYGECNLDAWVAPRHLHILEIRQCCRFSTLPAWMNCSLRDLSVLSMAVRVLPQEDIEILGRLPVLRYLELEVDHGTLGILQRSVFGADSFPCLVRCELKGFGEPVAFFKGAMPMLVNLHFEVHVLHVLVMKEEIASWFPGFDLGLGNLPSLQAITVDLQCRGSSREEMKEGEDFLSYFLSYVTEVHPNDPSFKIDMVSDDESPPDEDEGGTDDTRT